MADASFVQSSFLGGERSKFSQGRMEDPDYRISMNVSLNGFPIEEGAWVRRPGTKDLGPTRGGGPARVVDFHFTGSAPCTLELSEGYLRFFNSDGAIVQGDYATVVAVSNANPSVITLSQSRDSWATGDTVVFFPSGASTETGASALLSGQFTITKLTPTTFSLADAITGVGLDGSALDFGGQLFYVGKIHEYVTPYTSSGYRSVRTVQSDNELTLLHPNKVPHVVVPMFPGAPGFPPTFAFGEVDFVDGPYLDPQSGITVTPSATSGNITLTLGYLAWDANITYNIGDTVNYGFVAYVSLVGGNRNKTPSTEPTFWQSLSTSLSPQHRGFSSTDIGRHVRLWSAPANWAPGTSYSTGNIVTYNNAYYEALAASTGVVPDTDDTKWGPVAGESYARWTWGKISAVTSQTSATLDLRGDDLLNTNAITLWRFGAYSNTTGWPTCGCYHEGRLWLGSAYNNRFDASKSNFIFDFAPTEPDGTVGDNNAISYVLNSSETNPILWMRPNDHGIAMGTKENEWMISASQLSDPLTPTSIQAKRGTSHGSCNAEPIGVAGDVLFIQKHRRDIMDLSPDVFSGRYAAKNIARYSKHLTKSGIAEIAFQQVLTPVIWARTMDNQLIGCTYKHQATYGEEPVNFNGWHRHALGSGRSVTSIAAGPSHGGDLESLVMVTSDGTAKGYRVELLTDIFDEDGAAEDAWFLDSAVVPPLANVIATGVEFSGLGHLEGETVACFVAGLDLGQYTVTGGKITVPFEADADKLFTASYAASHTSTLYNTTTGSTIAQNIPSIPAGVWLANTGIVAGGAYFQGNPEFMWVDWKENEIYTWAGTGQGISVSDLDTGALKRSSTQHVYSRSFGMGIESDDHFYADGNISTNDGILQKRRKSDLAVVDSINMSFQTFSSPLFAFGNTYSKMVMGTDLPGDQNRVFFQTYKTNADIDDDMNITISPHEMLELFDPAPTFGPPLYGKQTRGRVTTNGYVSECDAFDCTSAVDAGSGVITITKYNLRTALHVNGAEVASGPNLAETVIGYVIAAALTYYLGPLGTLLGSFLGSLFGGLFGGGGPTAKFVDTFTTSTHATFVPSDIDPTWTAFNSTGAIAEATSDDMDAGIILLVRSASGPTNQSYVVKVSAVDGSILWKTAFPGTFSGSSTGIQKQLEVKARALVLLSKVSNDISVHVIDTRTGTMVTQAGPIEGALLNGNFRYSDTAGKIVMYSTFTVGSGSGTAPNLVPPLAGSVSTADILVLTTGPGAVYPVTQIDPGGGGTPYVILDGPTSNVSAIVGYPYASEGQLLRPISPLDSGARNGPAFAKTRRAHQFGAMLQNTQGVSFGTTFDKLHPAHFKTPGGIAYRYNQLFSGIHWDTVDDNYSFDSMLCWRASGPYPCNLLAIGGFLHTQDR